MKSSTGCMVWTWVGCLTRSLRQILPLPRCLPPRLPQPRLPQRRLLPLLLQQRRLLPLLLLPLLLPQRHQRLPALHLQERRLVLMKSSMGCMVWTWVGCLTWSLRQILPYCLPPRLLQHQVLPPRLLPLLLPQRHQRLPALHLQERRLVLMKSSTGCMVWTWVGCLTRSLRQILPLPRCLPPRLPQRRLLPLLLLPLLLPQRRLLPLLLQQRRLLPLLLLPLLLPQRHQRLPALHLQERRLVLMKSSTGCMVWTWVGCLTKSLRQILPYCLPPRLLQHQVLPPRLLPLLLPQRHQRLPAQHLQERRLVLMKSSTGCMVWTWVGCLTKSLRQILQDPLPRLPRHPLLPQHQPNRPKSPRQPRRPLLPVPLPQP